MSFGNDKSTDILIIGGGVIGLAIARELRRRENFRKITIVERGRVGGESSFAAAGMLAPNAETEKIDEFAEFCRRALKIYPEFAAEIRDETGVDIELDCSGTLYLALTESDSEEIRRRFRWQKAAGLPVEHLSAAETRRVEPFVSPDVRESLFFPEDWQVENRKLLVALRKYAESGGIEIVEDAEIKSVNADGEIIVAEGDRQRFSAETVVVATGAWTSHIKAGSAALPEVKPIRGQMIGFQTAKRLFRKVIYTPRGYIVPRGDGRILVGATIEDVGFDKSNTNAGIEFLRETAYEVVPSLANLEIAERWAGLRPRAADNLPVLGAVGARENLLVATAHYRNGILLAPLTARIIAEKIAGAGESKFLRAFSPRRFFPAQFQTTGN